MWWEELGGDEIRSIYRGQLKQHTTSLLPDLVNVTLDYLCANWRHYLRPSPVSKQELGHSYGRLELRASQVQYNKRLRKWSWWHPVLVAVHASHYMILYAWESAGSQTIDIFDGDTQSRLAAPGTHLETDEFDRHTYLSALDFLRQSTRDTLTALFSIGNTRHPGASDERQIEIMGNRLIASIWKDKLIRFLTTNLACLLTRNDSEFIPILPEQIREQWSSLSHDEHENVWREMEQLLPKIAFIIALTAENGRWSQMIVDRLYRPTLLIHNDLNKYLEIVATTGQDLDPMLVLQNLSLTTLRQLCVTPNMPKPFLCSSTYKTLVQICRHLKG
jgi:hypothetical protein